ncbi:MAG TPA: hypothetical protein VK335_11470 [Bryobacteraceae bacterium]|nr:hypothetical protein [Bryobacteraceae bacterium]
MQEFAGKPVRALVVWEPVLPTDWFAPSTMTLSRMSDTRVAQFWDKGRLVSRSMGEHDRRSIVWDYIAVYPAGARWDDSPPEASYHDGPVVQVTDAARAAVAQALMGKQPLVH